MDRKPASFPQAVDDLAHVLLADRSAVPAIDDRRRDAVDDKRQPYCADRDRNERHVVEPDKQAGNGQRHRKRGEGGHGAPHVVMLRGTRMLASNPCQGRRTVRASRRTLVHGLGIGGQLARLEAKASWPYVARCAGNSARSRILRRKRSRLLPCPITALLPLGESRSRPAGAGSRDLYRLIGHAESSISIVTMSPRLEGTPEAMVEIRAAPLIGPGASLALSRPRSRKPGFPAANLSPGRSLHCHPMAPYTPELSGIAIVGAGSFNPAIFQPSWLREKELIAENAAVDAQQRLVVSPELTAFTADWLTAQVTLQQAVFATVEAGRDVDLRDVVVGIFQLLPETPVDAVRINLDTHFRVEAEPVWHAIGDAVLPKAFWEPLFGDGNWLRRPDDGVVGLRSVTAEVARVSPPGYVRVEVAPSVRIALNGVYVGVNSHFQLTTPEQRGSGFGLAELLLAQWDDIRDFEQDLVTNFLSSI